MAFSPRSPFGGSACSLISPPSVASHELVVGLDHGSLSQRAPRQRYHPAFQPEHVWSPRARPPEVWRAFMWTIDDAPPNASPVPMGMVTADCCRSARAAPRASRRVCVDYAQRFTKMARASEGSSNTAYRHHRRGHGAKGRLPRQPRAPPFLTLMAAWAYGNKSG